MTDNIIIPDQKCLDQTIAAMAADGADKLHILTDFDNTLTRAFVNGEKTHSIIANIRLGNYLGDEFTARAFDRTNKYLPFETDLSIPFSKRVQLMSQWWNETHADMINSGLSKQLLNKICSERPLVFRNQINDFENILKQYNIPMVIMSASSGYMIRRYLEQAGLFADNVDILANWFEFDASEKMVAAKNPIIHSLNKYEVLLKDYPIFERIKNRRNVILMGDNVDDIGMVKGFDYNNLIKIGFLNKNVDERLDDFKKNFDVIILNDDGMEQINTILKIILSTENKKH